MNEQDILNRAVAILQQRFPREWEIAVLQAQVEALKAEAEGNRT